MGQGEGDCNGMDEVITETYVHTHSCIHTYIRIKESRSARVGGWVSKLKLKTSENN